MAAPPQVIVQVGAPTQQQMSDNFLPQCNSLYIAQSKRGWCFEHFCFETESEFKVYTDSSKLQHVYTLTEQSSALGRMCCGMLHYIYYYI